MIGVTVEPGEIAVDRDSELTVELTNRADTACLQLAFRVELPETFVLVAGATRIEADRLEPGESRHLRLTVRPRQEGEWWLTSHNFAYRDATGRLQRVRDLRRPVKATPARPEPLEPPADVRVKLLTAELPLGQWSALRGVVTLIGGARLARLWVRVSGRIESESPGQWQEVHPPSAGSGSEFSLRVRGMEAGEAVPVALEAHFADSAGRAGTATERRSLSVRPEPRPENEPSPETSRRTRILVLCANPTGTTALELGPEARDLEAEIRRSKHRDRLSIRIQHATRPEDMLREILEVEPEILHFSGHGVEAGALVLENELGGIALVSASALVNLAKLVAGTVECVVLNACFSAVQAAAMARHVPYVIGMSRQVEDRHAREFTLGFYMAIGAGEPVDRAFRYGCQLIEMKCGEGHDVPRLLCREHCGAEPSLEARSS